MSVGSDALKQRTLRFAVNVLRLADRLPRSLTAQAVGRQLARSGSSIGANYRAACVARSRAEFIARLGIVVEEAEESLYWLNVIVESSMLEAAAVQDLQDLHREAAELLAIFAKSFGTARANARSTKQSPTK